MNKIERNELLSLEQYAEDRVAFRKKVLAHKQNRKMALNENAVLYFEDRLTMQYQIQEMLRIEKIFEKDAIQEELDAYNPLIPDGCNLKATFMIEYGDENERQLALGKLVGVEEKVWIQIDDMEKIYAIADEDMERNTADKTSAVHFMRFEFTSNMVEGAKAGRPINMGIDHEHMQCAITPVPEKNRASLIADFA